MYLTKQKQSHKHRKQTYIYQRREGEKKKKNKNIGLTQIQMTIHKLNNKDLQYSTGNYIQYLEMTYK